MAADQALRDVVREQLERWKALPGGDEHAAHAFVGDIERILSANDFSAEPPLALHLHYFAADALGRLPERTQQAGRARVIGHVDAGCALADETTSPLLIGQFRNLRARTYIAAVDELDTAESALAIAACDEALADPAAADENQRPTLAYQAALFRIRRDGWPEDETGLERLESLLAAAHEGYTRLRHVEQAADAAALVAQAACVRLEHHLGTPDAAMRAFDTAWHRINEAMAATDAGAAPLKWGQRNRLAAHLLELRPGGPADSGEIMRFLDRALHGFEVAGDAQAIASCSAAAIVTIDRERSDWPEPLLNRYEFYLDTGEHAGVDPDPAFAHAVRSMMRANALLKTCLAVTPARRAELLARARTASEESATWAAANGHDDLAATSFKLAGSSLLGDQPRAGEPPAAEAAFDRDAVTAACAMFEAAIAHAVKAGDAATAASSRRMLGSALGQRLQHGGETAVGERCIEVLEGVLESSEGEELATASANLATVALLLAQAGNATALGPARRALQRVPEASFGANDAALRQHLSMLQWRLDEFEFLGPGADAGLRPADGKPLEVARTGVPFRVMRREASPTGEVATLLLLPHGGAGVEGVVSALSDAAGLFGLAAIGCGRCGQKIRQLVPLTIDADIESPLRTRFEAVADGRERCPRCDAAVQIQSAFVLRKVSLSPEPVVVLPDLFSTFDSEFRMHQAVAAVQVHDAATGGAAETTVWIRWTGCLRRQDSPGTDAAFFAQRAEAMALTMRGMATHDAEAVLAGLRALAGSDMASDTELQAAAMKLLDIDDGETAAEWSEVIAGLAELTAKDGPERTADQLRAAWQRNAEAGGQFDAEIQVAAEPATRHAFLRRLISELADYSPDRANALYDQMGLAAELEFRDLRRRGPGDDAAQRLEVVQAMIGSSREAAAQSIERDREAHNSARAKRLIAQRLDAGAPFVLVLRAFAIDAPMREMSAEARSRQGLASDPRVGWRVSTFRFGSTHVVDRVCALLPEGLPVITIANVLDMNPPRQPALLFVTDLEWRQVAFSLIAEAAAIVLVLPGAAGAATEGVAVELRAIRALARGPATIGLLANDDGDEANDEIARLLAGSDAAPRDGSPVRLEDFGVVQVLEEGAATSDVDAPLRRRVEALVTAAA